ncbi:MAG: hypothetical protein ACE5GA_02850, partial [Candidatus Zixiibacteriota bacterium]
MNQISDVSISFLTDSQAPGWIALFILAAVSLYLYNRTNPPLSRALKTLLAGLRALALLALFVS